MCSAGNRERSGDENSDPSKTGNLFSYEEARTVYRTFSKFNTTEVNEATLFTLIRLDAIISDPVDAVQLSIKAAELLPQNAKKTSSFTNSDFDSSDKSPEDSFSKKKKSIPQESIERLRSLLSSSCAWILDYCRETFIPCEITFLLSVPKS